MAHYMPGFAKRYVTMVEKRVGEETLAEGIKIYKKVIDAFSIPIKYDKEETVAEEVRTLAEERIQQLEKDLYGTD